MADDKGFDDSSIADVDDDDCSDDQSFGTSDDEGLDYHVEEVVPEVSDSRWSSCSVITKESLLAAQNEDVRKVTELLGFKEHHARTILMHYRWDVERIFELLDQFGVDKVVLEAGVVVADKKDTALSGSLYSSVTCNVCFEELPSNAIVEMDCGHPYCNDCWTEYFIVKINNGQSRCIKCMAPKCTAICDEAIVRKLVSSRDPYIAHRFDQFLLESYIEDNNKVKWCPSIPNCGSAIRVKGDVCCEVECTCGLQFCFSCLSEAHSPCSCLMWKLWTAKCHDESETINWITVNTKFCPKCHKIAEKNGGCNLVVCICGQPFCWLCGGATGRDHTWTTISGHTCGRFKEDVTNKIENARKELHRYMHYHNRYKAHKDSLKLENSLKEKIKDKIIIAENGRFERKDYSWILNGLNRLSQSRHIIANSYPFAFYMFGNDLLKNEMTVEQKNLKQYLFEDQQQQLESHVEKLSLLLGQDFQEFCDDNAFMEMQRNVLDLSKIVDKLCREMYLCIDHDLLDCLPHGTHDIAPYKSKGIEMASELSFSSEV